MHAKFPDTTWPIWLSVIVLALVLVGLCRLSRWCYVLAVPVALLSIYNGWGTLSHNVSFRESMIQQLGFSYLAQYAFSFVVPVMALAVYAFYDFTFGRKRTA